MVLFDYHIDVRIHVFLDEPVRPLLIGFRGCSGIALGFRGFRWYFPLGWSEVVPWKVNRHADLYFVTASTIIKRMWCLPWKHGGQACGLSAAGLLGNGV
jgi:hypothetical protein